MTLTLEELGKILEEREVCDVLTGVSTRYELWSKDETLAKEVLDASLAAKIGIKKISEGITPINQTSTFGDMRSIDRKMYDDTLEFLLPLIQAGIYSV